MTLKKFKEMFGEIAARNGLQFSFGGWFRETSECLAVLELQKSNFGNYLELNIKLFIVGLFGKIPSLTKVLVTRETGNVFRRAPVEYNEIFSLENQISDDERKNRAEAFFQEFLVPFLEKASTKEGILNLEKNGEIFVLPAIRTELMR